MMFARHLTPYEAEKAERERMAARKPALALASFNPDPPKPAEQEMFVWKDVGELFR
jgi:hypothetical protein